MLDQLWHSGFMNMAIKEMCIEWKIYSHPIYCGLAETIPAQKLVGGKNSVHFIGVLTLDIRHALLQNLLKDLGVVELLANLLNNALREFLLLADLHLSLISDP